VDAGNGDNPVEQYVIRLQKKIEKMEGRQMSKKDVKKFLCMAVFAALVSAATWGASSFIASGADAEMRFERGAGEIVAESAMAPFAENSSDDVVKCY
jgi:hypothetical protein